MHFNSKNYTIFIIALKTYKSVTSVLSLLLEGALLSEPKALSGLALPFPLYI